MAKKYVSSLLSGVVNTFLQVIKITIQKTERSFLMQQIHIKKESAEKEKASEAKPAVKRAEDENLLGHKSDSKRKQIHESEEGEKRRKKKIRLEKIVGRAFSSSA